MRVLLIHNNYGSYSGEEAVVDKQIILFRSMGYEVDVFRKDSAGFRDSLSGNIKGFFSGFYSRGSVWEIKQILTNNKPDIVVVHNLYPFISPAILKYIKSAGVPVVMTVHNYRLICPTGLFMRNSEPCELCLDGSEWNCIKYNCEHSFFKSVAYAGRNWYARETKAYIDNVSLYACLTKFQALKLKQAGFDDQRMKIIPNFVDISTSYVKTKGEYVAISGRLSKEKGIDLILKVAKRTPQIKYVFAGAKRESDVWSEEVPFNCIFLGYLSQDALIDFYSNSKFLLIGSLCYEGFPMAILEAASYGKPAIGPGHAGFLEIIDDGVTGMHFIPGNADNMEQKLISLWHDDHNCEVMGQRAFEKIKTVYSSNVVKEKWQQLFNKLNIPE